MPRQSSQQPVKVSVERLLEREVNHIGRNGEETYIKPFSLSEELSYFASKIDFHGTHEDLLTDEDSKKNGLIEENKDLQDGENKSNTDSKWAWESVHSKLRIALSEVCVMLDVLECLHRKKYLVLDPIHQSTEPNKQTVKMLGSRKCLAQVGSLVAKGARSLTCLPKKNTNEVGVIFVTDNETVDEYYMQLMHLRQYWRLKKTGLQITGDVTYRSVGSHFWHPGLMEVKAFHELGSVQDRRTLVVNISPDLMQFSRITVNVVDSNINLPWTAHTNLIPWRRSKTAFDWENNLQLAQLHLFNLEIFSILSNDAFQDCYYNIEVLDSRICCRILDNVEVNVTHHVGEFKDEDESSQGVSVNDLTLLLSDLLLQHHSKNILPCSLYPATSIHQHKPMRSSSFHNVLNKAIVPKESMLKVFLEKAKHKVWVKRLSSYLDKKSKTVKNSILIPHWNTIKYKLISVVNISVVTKSYAITIKSSILVTIINDNFKLALENGDELLIPCELGMLQELLDLELQNHMIKIANSLCVEHGWSVIQTSPKYSVFQEQITQMLKMVQYIFLLTIKDF